jgi:hypothetical protein
MGKRMVEQIGECKYLIAIFVCIDLNRFAGSAVVSRPKYCKCETGSSVSFFFCFFYGGTAHIEPWPPPSLS